MNNVDRDESRIKSLKTKLLKKHYIKEPCLLNKPNAYFSFYLPTLKTCQSSKFDRPTKTNNLDGSCNNFRGSRVSIWV